MRLLKWHEKYSIQRTVFFVVVVVGWKSFLINEKCDAKRKRHRYYMEKKVIIFVLFAKYGREIDLKGRRESQREPKSGEKSERDNKCVHLSAVG